MLGFRSCKIDFGALCEVQKHISIIHGGKGGSLNVCGEASLPHPHALQATNCKEFQLRKPKC